MFLFAFLYVVFALAFAETQGAIHAYADASMYATSDGAVFDAGVEGAFASTRVIKANAKASDSMHSRDNGEAYIALSDVVFARDDVVARAGGKKQGKTGRVNTVTFDARAFDAIGVARARDDGVVERKLCCDETLASEGACEDVGGVVVRRDARTNGASTPRTSSVWFEDDDVEARAFEDVVRIEQTGMYHVWFVVCDPELAGVRVRGKTVWKNPHGYLPGRMAPNLPFFGFACAGYLVLGFAWTVAYIAHWKELLELHNCITAVVALGMCETAVWYFDYANFNATGYRPYVATIFAVLLGSLRTTLSRALVLVVSMGYGVVRPTLGGVTAKVIALCACYFCSAAIKDVVEHVGTVDDLKPGAKLLLILPVSALDALFLVWTFTSLSKTLTQLLLRRQMQKLALYRVFTNALALTAVLSLMWLGFEVWFKSTDVINQKWEFVWVIGAFWHVLSFVLLCVICLLWRPTDMSARYAYSDMAKDNISEESWWSQLVEDDESIKGTLARGANAPADRVMTSAKKSRELNDFSLDDVDAEQLELETGKME